MNFWYFTSYTTWDRFFRILCLLHLKNLIICEFVYCQFISMKINCLKPFWPTLTFISRKRNVWMNSLGICSSKPIYSFNLNNPFLCNCIWTMDAINWYLFNHHLITHWAKKNKTLNLPTERIEDQFKWQEFNQFFNQKTNQSR